jgi:membrane protein
VEPDHRNDAVRPRDDTMLRKLMRLPLARYVREAREKDLGTHLLAISAQQLLCTAPLAIALGAVGKRLTGVSFAGVISHVLSLSPQAEREVSSALAGSPTVSLSALLLNLAFAIVFGVGLAATLQRGLELIWRLPRAAYLGSTVRGVAWAVALPVMISAVVLIGRTGHYLRHHIGQAVVVGFSLQILAIAAFIWWTQYLLLSRRVPFKKLWLPTLVSTLAIAVVIIVGRQMISGQIVPAYRAYGSVGIGIVFSAWMAIASSSSSVGLAVGAWLQLRRDERRGARVPAAPAPQQPAVTTDVAAEVAAEAAP